MFFRWFIFSCLCFMVFGLDAQTTYIDQLPDSLQPQIVELDKVPLPQTRIAGNPVVKIFPENIAQGQAFFTTYTSDDGLPMDAINFSKCTLYDSKGNLWFASQGGGVSKYDGKSFITYTTEQGLPHNKIYSIAEDNSGNIWFGTHGGGVSKYDGKAFFTITSEQGLANNIVLSIYEDQLGYLWFGTHGGGVSKYDGNQFVTYTTEQGLVQNKVYSIAEDNSGNLWFGTYKGVSKFDGKNFTTYSTEDGLVNNEVLCITNDKSGNLWFGTRGGACKYDGKQFVKFTGEQGLPSISVGCIFEDKLGNLWFGTFGNGVSKYDGESIITYTSEQGLAYDIVLNIVEDKLGSLWFGTFQGVSEFEGNSFTTYSKAQGLSGESILSIIEDKSGNLWFGTHSEGVSKYDGKSLTSYTVEQGLAYNSILSMLEDQSGDLWFGTYLGLSKFDGNSFKTFTTEQGLASNGILCMTEDQSGNLWFATNGGGVSKYNGKSFTNFNTKQGLANNVVYCLKEDKKGNLWFGTNGGGVSKFDGNSFITYTTDQGLADNVVLNITEDKSGNLWFGTNGGGMSMYDGKSFITYTTEQGLPNNSISAMRFDDQDRLIIGTNFGLTVVEPKEVETMIKDGELKEFKTFNQFTGYPIRDINSGTSNGAIHIDSKGILWAGHGRNGVTRINLDAINKSNEAPNVVINKVRINGEKVCYYTLSSQGASSRDTSLSAKGDNRGFQALRDSIIQSQQEVATYGKVLNQLERDNLKKSYSGVTFDSITSFYSIPENLVLPYEHNAVTIEFNAIEPGRNHLINYQFMLEGYEDSWRPVSKKTEANYNNLSEGNYTFIIRAQSPWGVWSEPIKFSFEVLPPWYRTIWAYFCYALFGLLFVWGLVQLQTKRLKEQRKVLKKKVEVATNQVVKEKREAEKQRDEAEEQRSLVEQKNIEIERAHEQLALHHKEISGSINYAKRIQKAIMPSVGALAEALKDGFIIYEPKEVVAGDFFWMEPQGEVVYFAAADCTGHGVPGAMVSVVCSNALTKALLEEGIRDTGKLLDRTREIVIERFARSGDEVRDGMDISLCALNMKTKELKWAGANNPLWIVRANKGDKSTLVADSASELFSKIQIDECEVFEIKPDKQPIGKYSRPEPFTEHTIQLNKGDSIYIFTDGYQDQFGGPKGKKFRARQLKEILAKNHFNSMSELDKLLIEKLREWQGNLEQVDDVCVIGVRI